MKTKASPNTYGLRNFTAAPMETISVDRCREWSVSRYDEAIVSLRFLVSSMNSDSKIVLQTLCFSTTSEPESIEIP